MSWIHFSIAATLFLSVVVVFTKGLTTYQLAPMVINFYFFFVTSLLFLACGMYRGDSFVLPKGSYVTLGGLALAALAYNDFFVKAVSIAPNAAYPQAIVAASVLITALFGVIFFGAQISALKLLGLLVTASGVAMICYLE